MPTTITSSANTATHTLTHAEDKLCTSPAACCAQTSHVSFPVTGFLHCQTFEWMLIHKYLIGPSSPWEETPNPQYLTNKTEGRGGVSSVRRDTKSRVCSSQRVDASQRSVTVMFYWRPWQEGREQGGQKEGWRRTEGEGRETEGWLGVTNVEHPL